ncbi:MAG: polysaccharide deacetylase family protein, partial [Dokdonella sp.]
VEKIVAAGHALGNHSYDHPRFTRIPWSEQIKQIERTDRLLSTFDGRTEHRFRPPSGQFNAAMLARFAAQRRNLAYWSYDSLDYQRKPLQQMVDILRAHPPRAGDIVLMHDDSETTSRALAMLIPEWRAAGLQMLALPEVGNA